MYEIRYEPDRSQIMRHAAWNIQRESIDRCHRIRALLGFDPVFVLTTALGLMGIGPPDGCLLSAERVHIGMFDRGKRRDFPQGVVCHTWNQLACRNVTVDVCGFRCTTPEATFAHMLRHCAFEECIVLADRMACRDKLLRRSTVERLDDFIAAHRHIRGGTTGRRALSLSRAGTDSPSETRLRLRMLEHGLPEPEVNHRVLLPGRGERFLDMAYVEPRIGIEFHGRHHMDRYVEDTIRSNRLAAAHWTLFQAWGSTLENRDLLDELLSSIGRSLSDAGAGDSIHPPRSLWDLSDRRNDLCFIGKTESTVGNGMDDGR